MADKGKRLRKILTKIGMKGQLKPVGNLDEAHIILIDDPQCIKLFSFMGKDAYKQFLEEGQTFPEHIVHFLVSANPRNKWNIEQRLLTSAVGTIKTGYQ